MLCGTSGVWIEEAAFYVGIGVYVDNAQGIYWTFVPEMYFRIFRVTLSSHNFLNMVMGSWKC